MNPFPVDLTLSNEQCHAYNEIMDFVFNQKKGGYVLSGVAGSGKTTLVTAMLHTFCNTFGFNIACIAFTGRAASVLYSKCVKSNVHAVTASTIHSFLYKPVYDDKLQRVKFEPKPLSEIRSMFNLIVVDESQMVNEKMFNEIMDIGLPVIFLGDKEQLPPVTDNNNPFNIMEVANFHMTHIQRQAADNPIIALSKEIREQGNINRTYESDAIKFVNKRTITAKTILQLPTPVEVILTGTNKLRNSMNSIVRAAKGFNTIHADSGETLVCLKNGASNEGRYIANGQRYAVIFVSDVQEHQISANKTVLYRLYTLQDLDAISRGMDTQDANTVLNVNIPEECWEDQNLNAMDFNKKKYMTFGFFTFGYAMSVWKATGSEFKSVLFFDEDVSYFVDRKKFRYTAVTRAKEELIIAT